MPGHGWWRITPRGSEGCVRANCLGPPTSVSQVIYPKLADGSRLPYVSMQIQVHYLVMALSCEEHYRLLNVACGKVLAASFKGDVAGLHGSSHSFLADLEVWRREVLAQRPEASLLESAINEYQFGLLAVAQGQYRQAFMALRLSLELLLGAVSFSANELELRSWLAGRKDLVWSTLVSSDVGPLSKPFVRVFYEPMADEATHYRAMAEKVYRECSEHVHGNAQAALTSAISYQPDVFQDWHGKAKTIRLVTSFSLCARYIGVADSRTRSKLEDVLLETLGHLPAVRALFGAPVEAENA